MLCKEKRTLRLFFAFITAILLAFFCACLVSPSDLSQVSAASYDDLGLDETDRSMMVQASDGYYYWIVMDVAGNSFREVRFQMRGDRVTSFETIQDRGGLDLYRDGSGHYLFNACEWYGEFHDVFTCVQLIAYLNAVYYGTDGKINVRIDYAGTLYAYSVSSPTGDMYFKGRDYRGVRIYNSIAAGESSWVADRSVGYGAIFQLQNGTYCLKTRQLVLDGGDHYTFVLSTCSNSVYVSDGCSYYSYGDEFLHGYTSSIISNHHSNQWTTCYGESYVQIEGGYIHDCLVGIAVNNRLYVVDTVFENCTNAVSVGGSGGSAGGYAYGGQNGLWNLYGSRAMIERCRITDGASVSCRGMAPYAISIGGNYVADSDAVSVTIKDTEINAAGRGINIEGLTGKRQIRVEGCTIANPYGTDGLGIYHCNGNGGKLYLYQTTITGEGTGLYHASGTISFNSGTIYGNDWGITNRDVCCFNGGNVRSNRSGGIYQDGALYMSGSAAVDKDNRIYLVGSHIVNVSGGLSSSMCGRLDMPDDQRRIGRLLVHVDYTSDRQAQIEQAEKFSLWSDTIRYDRDGSPFSGIAHTAAVRSAGRLCTAGIDASYGFLSASYTLHYDGNMAGEGVVTTVPDDAWYYWGETILAEGLSDRAVTNMPFCSTGWADRTDAVGPDYTQETYLWTCGNRTVYATWELDGVRILYYGNRNTGYDAGLLQMCSIGGIRTDAAGEPYFIAQDTGLAPINPYTKEDAMPYSFVGWNTDRSATYQSAGNVAAQNKIMGEGTAVTVSTVKQAILDGRLAYDWDGSVDIYYYAIWDRYPKLTTGDLYLYREAAAQLTAEDLYRHMAATDREDGVLDSRYFDLQDFDPSGYVYAQDAAVYDVVCGVTDGAGNRTEGTLRLHILKAQQLEETSYVRFIDTEFLEAEEGAGGLLRESKWRSAELSSKLQNALRILDADEGYVLHLKSSLHS